MKVAYSIDSSVLSNDCIYRLTVLEYSIDFIGIAASLMQVLYSIDSFVLSKFFIYRLIVVEQLLTLLILLTFQ